MQKLNGLMLALLTAAVLYSGNVIKKSMHNQSENIGANTVSTSPAEVASLNAAVRILSEEVQDLNESLQGLELQTVQAQQESPAISGRNEVEHAPPTTVEREQAEYDARGLEYANNIANSGHMGQEDAAKLNEHMRNMSIDSQKSALRTIVRAINEQRLEIAPGAMF